VLVACHKEYGYAHKN